MNNRSLAVLALAAFIAVPSVAGAQMSTPKPMMSSTSKAMTSTKKTKKSMKNSTSALNPSSPNSQHPYKAGQAQSTDPGAPNYTGSSGTGK